MNQTAYILHRLNNNKSYVIMYWFVHKTYLFGDIHTIDVFISEHKRRPKYLVYAHSQ